MKSLHDYFEQAKNRPRSVSEEQLKEFVLKQTALGSTTGGQPTETANVLGGKSLLGKIALLTVLVLGLTAGTWLFVKGTDQGISENQEESNQENSTYSRAMVIEGCGCPLSEFVGLPNSKRSAVAPASLSTMPMLELSTNDLKRIGIEKHSDGITLYRQRPGGNDEYTERDEFRSGDEDNLNMFGIPPPDIVPLPIYPRLVTDDLGRLRRFYFSYQEIDPKLEDSIRMVQQHYSYLSDAGKVKEAVDSMNNHPRFGKWFQELHQRSRLLIDFNKLVPVYIRSKESTTDQNSKQKRCRSGVIVWFDPTPALFQMLPDNWQEQIRPTQFNTSEPTQGSPQKTQEQTQTVDKNRVHSTERNQANEPTLTQNSVVRPSPTTRPEAQAPTKERNTVAGPGPGEPMLHVNPGAIEGLSLLPNPVDKDGSLLLQLQESRRVGVSLHSIGGTQLGMLIGDQFLDAGKHSIALSFSDVPPGIYLLAVSTDKNELQVHRIIVR